MSNTINSRPTHSDAEQVPNLSPQEDELGVIYHQDLEQLIRDCEEIAAQKARQAQQTINKQRPSRPPYGFD